jgi:hypothetical protein
MFVSCYYVALEVLGGAENYGIYQTPALGVIV